MNTIAVIQARMSSRRFPGKMLTPLCGRPLVIWALERAAKTPGIDGVVLATSTDSSDDPLAFAAQSAGFSLFRGSLDDVLGRFLAAAQSLNADLVLRLTGDCPLTDPEILSRLIALQKSTNADYASNISPPSFPDGLDAEIMTMKALNVANTQAKETWEREHVTPFLRERRDQFQVQNLLSTDPAPQFCWSIDTPEDLQFVSELIAKTGKTDPNTADLLSACRANPELAKRCTKQRNTSFITQYQQIMDKRAPKPVITKSDALWKRAEGLIPAGTQTLSKGPTQWVRGFAPKYLVKGKGCQVWDADGNVFIDYPMGLGPITIGHGHPAVVEAVAKALADGNAFSLMHPLEITLAERIRDIVPCAKDGMVRFGKNGSDATSACIRAARAKTGRNHIARHGYHGWQDWSIEATYGIRAKGVPQTVMDLTHPFPYNDLPALEKILSTWPCAAVILEPVNLTAPAPGYLAGVKELAHKYGALLVFDEVITGFRYARGGAQEYFGVTPDLAAMGKGVANGLPLSIVCGTKEAMAPFEEIFFSFTFGGETLSLAAALATLDVMERENYWAHVWRVGRLLQDGFGRLAKAFNLENIASCRGLPPWTICTFSDFGRFNGLQMKTLFQQEMLRRGILFSGSQFLSLAHQDAEIQQTIHAYQESMRVLRVAIDNDAVDSLTQGQCNEVIFKRG